MNPINQGYEEWCKHNDEATLARLHKLLYEQALRAIRAVLWQDRPDLASDAASNALLRIHQFRGESTFATWSYKIARNLALMELRSRASRRESQLIFEDNLEASAREDTSWQETIGSISTTLTPRERTLLAAILLGIRPSEWAASSGLTRMTGWRTWQRLKTKLLRHKSQH